MKNLGKIKTGHQIARTLASAVRQRLLHGPRRPSWSCLYELVIAIVTDQGSASRYKNFTQRRRAIDRAGEREAGRSRAKFFFVDAGGVPAEWVTPMEGFGERVVLYLHGGAYVAGSPRSHRPLLAGLSRALNARVLAIDYRLAPEAPCPAAIEDVVAAYQWLLERGHRPEQLTIAGDSAGGGLTVTSLLALRDLGARLPKHAVLLSPWLDLRACADDLRCPEGACDYLSREALESAAIAYAGGLSREDPRVSPLDVDLSGLPELLILAGGQELILRDSKQLAQRAEAAGLDVTLFVEEDEVHVYPYFHDINPRGRAALERIARFVEP